MRERGGSDVLRAREDPGSRGREASKHSPEVGIPQVRRSQEPSDGDRTPSWERLRSGAREKERWTQEVSPRTTTTPVVLKASADHTVVESRRREDRTAFSERQW